MSCICETHGYCLRRNTHIPRHHFDKCKNGTEEDRIMLDEKWADIIEEKKRRAIINKNISKTKGAPQIYDIPKEGPGTELKKLISWFGVGKDNCGSCANHVATMNFWGPEKCLRRIHTIRRWLKHSAMRQRLPYSERLVDILIKRAINNAMASDSNNCPKEATHNT